MDIIGYPRVADKVPVQVVLSVDLERRLRETIYRVKGMKKGNISEAVAEAIEDWIARHAETPRRNKP